MIDDTGLDEFHGSSRSRRRVFTLAAISLAAACIDEAPPDDAVAAELSSSEVLALCDELRDAVQRDDHPIECDSGDRYWVLPSNQTCRNADLSACTATVGQLRRCHELARQNPCSLPNEPSPADLSRVEPDVIFSECSSLEGCYPFVASTGYTSISTCTGADLSSLQVYDGVYEVAGLTGIWADPSCIPLPELSEGTGHFVLVATEASGAAEVVLQSCDAVADCQALAREIQATGSARSAEPVAAYNHLSGCGVPGDTVTFSLQSIVPDLPSCQILSMPTVVVLGEPSSPTVMFSGLTDTEVSPGCGSIIPPDAAEAGSCPALRQIRAMSIAPL
jgi:hypothetical protein